MCITAIANMQQSATKEGKSKCLFSKDHEIIPYIEQYWEAMTTMPRRVTQSWCDDIALILPAMNYSGCLFFIRCRYATVQRALVKDIHTIFSYEETVEQGQMYGLLSGDLTQIKPNYEAMVKGGTLRITDDGYAQGKLFLVFFF